MLSDEEKQRIVERAQFEAEMRKVLKSDDAPSAKWYDSKVGLLVIGAFITGLLVPAFQYSAETIKWRRQNAYENGKYRLSMMRDCLREFVLLSAFTAEAYEREQAALRKPRLQQKDVDLYLAQYVDLQNRRFQQNAKVSSLLIFFDDRDRMGRVFNSYLTVAGDFVSLLHETVMSKPSAGSIPSETPARIDSGIEKLNRSYDTLVDMMKNQIKDLEVMNELSM